ncbi:MAG: SRPBCC family protein [Ginsengibacter sp.]
MNKQNNKTITIETTINAPVEKVWKCWTTPEDIMKWNNASPDWHTPSVKNDLRKGGKFIARMEAKDGSMGFDFAGTYDEVSLNKNISFTLEDNRKVTVIFSSSANSTRLVESFETESTNSEELQRTGWQSILDNFKKYVEKSSS